jgi:leucyl-tRNA synthetase
MKKWLPVNRYSGGSEHTTMHLLYSRFFHKALYDLALVPTPEPFNERFNRGLILGTDGQKMSKRWGNVVNPDDVVKEFGTDAVRLYLAFIGPYNEAGSYPWNLDGVSAMRKFLERIVALSEKIGEDSVSEEVARMLAKAEAKSSEDSERFKFNTALSALMILVRDMEGLSTVPKSAYQDLLQMLAPFAPHIAEELWSRVDGKNSIHQAVRPTYDTGLLVSDTATVVVQVNGKRRGDVSLSPTATQDEALHEAFQIPAVAAALDGKSPKRVVYVAGKILNLVID